MSNSKPSVTLKSEPKHFIVNELFKEPEPFSQKIGESSNFDLETLPKEKLKLGVFTLADIYSNESKANRSVIYRWLKSNYPKFSISKEDGRIVECSVFRKLKNDFLFEDFKAENLVRFLYSSQSQKNFKFDLNSKIISDKNKKTKFYKWIHSNFKDKIAIQNSTNGSYTLTQKPQKTNSNQYYFASFQVQKTNLETEELISILANFLKTKIFNISIAGTKDKVAVTSQYIVVKYDNLLDEDETIRNFIELLDGGKVKCPVKIHKKVKILKYKPVLGPLNLGWHNGNEFEIILLGASPFSTYKKIDF